MVVLVPAAGTRANHIELPFGGSDPGSVNHPLTGSPVRPNALLHPRLVFTLTVTTEGAVHRLLAARAVIGAAGSTAPSSISDAAKAVPGRTIDESNERLNLISEIPPFGSLPVVAHEGGRAALVADDRHLAP